MPQRFWTFFNLPAVLLNPYNRTPHHDLCSCHLMFCPLNVQVWSPDYQRRGLQQPVSGPGAWSFSPADAPGLPEGKIHLSSFSDIILAVLLCSMSLTACCLCCSGDRLGLQVWLRCQHIWPAVHLCEPSQVSDITSNCGPLTLKDLLNYTHTHTHTLLLLHLLVLMSFLLLVFTSCLQGADASSETFQLHSVPAAGEASIPSGAVQRAAGDLQPGKKQLTWVQIQSKHVVCVYWCFICVCCWLCSSSGWWLVQSGERHQPFRLWRGTR